ncbi:hypothetical protein CANINC_001687 [Pichia inconspicua]|uniref:3-oxoacyl-[acyl-carrier-protein] reductase n=1 Tax=Pichia inconspicua TaxID=52247 RepID=A0A4T0X381_9ASCO|nr:hypothetical protein CANINC_001687 [[Candida] inconspicua]
MITRSLYNQHALITGGSKGLGKAIAERLSYLGCKVTLLARNEKLLKSNVEYLNRHFNLKDQKHDYVKFDLSKPESIENDLYPRLKSVNILINCAGLSQARLLINTPVTEIQDIINTNMLSPIILSKLFLRNVHKMKLINAHLVNISSVIGKSELQHNLVGTSVYSASKAGLSRFSDIIAQETERMRLKNKTSITITTIHPGHISDTDIGSSVRNDNEKLSLPKDTIDNVVDQVVTAVTV